MINCEYVIVQREVSLVFRGPNKRKHFFSSYILSGDVTILVPRKRPVIGDQVALIFMA